jgi:phosphate acetyltransferase
MQDALPEAQLRAKHRVIAAGYPGFTEGLDALDRGEIDAFAVEPVLRYEIANFYPARPAVVGTPFLRGDHVFALPANSEIRRRSINCCSLTSSLTNGISCRVPIVLTSRADSARTRLASCALSVLMADAERRGLAMRKVAE